VCWKQTSLEPSALPSAVARCHDTSRLIAMQNSPNVVSDSTSRWSHVNNDVAAEFDDDSAYVYSTDPDHESDDKETKQSEKVVQPVVLLCLL